jgi:hypothetical protein
MAGWTTEQARPRRRPTIPRTERHDDNGRDIIPCALLIRK